MRPVGKNHRFSGQWEMRFPTDPLSILGCWLGFDAVFQWAIFPTEFPTDPLSQIQFHHRVFQWAVGKSSPSYGAGWPGLVPGTPARIRPQVSNNNHKEEGAWAD